jgi:ketosteroid isomerase-like protein
MSQENVEAVQAVYKQWAKGNLRAGADLYDPLVLFIPFPDFPGGETHYLGVERMRQFMRGWMEPWTNLTMVAEGLIEAESSIVIAVCQRAVGKDSGAPSELRYTEVWTFRGHRVIRVEQFRDRAAALEAVGLSE